MTQQNYLEAELNQLIQSDLGTWKFLQEGSLDGVWYWDLENTENEWMSPEFWKTFGVDPATKKPSPSEWQDIIFEDDLKVALKNFEAHCANPDHPYDQIVRYRHANGSVVWVRCRGLAIRDEAGRPVRMLGAHTDITKIKSSEMDARAGWKAAEVANAELKSFSYSVSHDMKAPANTLGMLLNEVIEQTDGKLDADSRELLMMCVQTVERMKNLVEYVLDYTRVIGMAPETKVICLSEMASRAQENLMADIKSRGAVIEVDALPRIIAVPIQMELLLQNLISNAIKYCPSERTPRIRLHSAIDRTEGILRVTVTDNGMGISAKHQDRIFTLFQRLHGHDEIPGSGIGLPMCKRIALNHSGTIELVSSPEKGSSFSLCLPAGVLV